LRPRKPGNLSAVRTVFTIYVVVIAAGILAAVLVAVTEA
jgi:hypothetical protein